jgi:hypothetical protein
MTAVYDVWYRDPLLVLEQQIANPDFAGEFDFTPKRIFDINDKRQYTDLMSGNWCWEQAVGGLLAINNYIMTIVEQDKIVEDPENHGAMFVPVVLGSDKTTVSVATGNNEYWPLYLSVGNVQHHVRRGHRNAVTPIAFLAIPHGKPVQYGIDDETDEFQPHMSTVMIQHSENSAVRSFIHLRHTSLKNSALI